MWDKGSSFYFGGVMNKYCKSMLKVVKNLKEADQFKLSGPAKISVRDRSAFSLPAGPDFSCPGATKACEGCYAQKHRHLWTPVQTVMANNWHLLRKFESKNQTEEAAKAITSLIRSDAKVFRLYESGDFHSQWAIDMWAKVVRARPDVYFWAYTRSFNLKFSKLTRLPNFTLWASTDEYNLEQASKFVNRFRDNRVKYAYGPHDHNDPLPPVSFVCPVTNGKLDLKGACEKCMLCVHKSKTYKSVVFLKH